MLIALMALVVLGLLLVLLAVAGTGIRASRRRLAALEQTYRVLHAEKQVLETRLADHARDLQAKAAAHERITGELGQRDKHLRVVVQNLPVMVMALDEDNCCVMWNRECERVTGYSAADVVGNPAVFERLFPDPDYRAWLVAYAAQHGSFRDLEVKITTKNEEQRIVAWSDVSRQSPVPGWASWSIGFDVTDRREVEAALHEARTRLEMQVTQRTQELRAANDRLQDEVTQRQRAEIALRQSQNQLRVTLDALSDAVHVVDRNLRLALLNRQFRAWSQDFALETQLLGRTPFELFPFLPDRVADEYRQVFEFGEILTTEETTEVGAMKIVTETRKIPVFEGDEVIYVVTVVRDISARKHAEAALAHERNLLNTLVNHLPASIYVKDTAGRYVLANETMLRRLGVSDPADVIGLADADLLDPAQAGQNQADERRIVAGGAPLFNHEQTVTGPAGEERVILASKLPLKDPQGTITGLVGIELDITSLKQAQAQAFQLAIEQERSELLTRFIRDVSHEFANPFSVIKNSSYLVRHAPDQARRQHHLDVIDGQVYHLEKLVAGMLTMSQLDSGVPFKHTTIAAGTLLADAQMCCTTALSEKGLAFTAEIASDLPPLHGDAFYVQRALRNLLENAVLYTPPGGAITLRAYCDSGTLVIEVADTGIGIVPDDLPRIFERFYRVDKARTERGAGLGLPIARAIIERHQGTLTAESRPGEGSIFRINLPISST